MKKFYFSMGVGDTADTGMPYKGGHVLVMADTMQEARQKYIAIHPHPRCPETVGNYAFDYTEEQFGDSATRYPNMGVCHEIIGESVVYTLHADNDWDIAKDRLYVCIECDNEMRESVLRQTRVCPSCKRQIENGGKY